MRNLTIITSLVLLTTTIFGQTWEKSIDPDGDFDQNGALTLNDNSIAAYGTAFSWQFNMNGGLLSNCDNNGILNFSKYYFENALETILEKSVQLPNGKIVSVGYQYIPQMQTQSRGWILTTNPTGNIIQSNYIGDTTINFAELHGISVTNDGGYVVCGNYENTPGDREFYVAKFLSDGNMEWDLIVENTSGGDDAYDVIQTSNGSYVAVGELGRFNGEYNELDVIQLHIDNAGNITKKIGSGEIVYDDYAYSVLELPSGNIVTVGRAASFEDSFGDLFIRKTDASGNIIWGKTYNTVGQDIGYQAINYNNEILITGYTSDLQNPGYGFLMTIDTDGNITRCKGISDGFSDYRLKNSDLHEDKVVTGGISYYVEGSYPILIRTDINDSTCYFFDTTFNVYSHNTSDSIYAVPSGFSGVSYGIASSYVYTPYKSINTNCFSSPNVSCMLANYPFSNGSTQNILGNGYDLYEFAPVDSTDRNGDPNMAYHFNGIDYMNNYDLPSSFTGYTIMGWAKLDSLNPKQGLILLNGTQFGVDTSTVGIYVQDSTIYGLHQSANESFIGLTGIEVDTNWFHYSLTYNQSSLTLYMDGIYAGSVPATDMASQYGSFSVGAEYEPSIFGYVNGLYGSLDEIKLYQCALSASEIDSIYQSEKPLPNCAIVLTPSITDVTCTGTSDGSVSIVVSGNIGSHTTQWDNGFTGDIITNLSGGTYTATVTDSVGCMETIMATVNTPLISEFQINGNNSTCDQGNGTASCNIMVPNYPPYTFTWSNGDMESNVTGSTADSLWAGPWNVAITDGNGCIFNESVYIGEDGGPTVSETITNAACFEENSGAINLTISNANGNYTVEWTSGGTSASLTGLNAGTYTYLVNDESGCTTVGSVDITQPSKIEIIDSVVTNPNCGIADGAIQAIAAGGAGSLTYSWDASANNQIGATANSLAAGSYEVEVADANGCMVSHIFDLNDLNGPSVYVQSILAPRCNISLGTINIFVNGGTSPYSYEWNTGATSKNISGINPGTYSVVATDANGCSGAKHAIVDGVRPQTPEICIVTVDTITGTNLIAWEKPSVNPGLDHYVIYREGNAAGIYDSIGTVNYSQLSVFTDPIANPEIRAWRYKLAAVDSCGVESALSAEHKTLHLTVNLGLNNSMNLIWDEYIGFTYGSYIIARYHISTGWMNIDTIPSTNTSYTDLAPPSAGSGLKYSVEVIKPTPCQSTKAQDHNSTRSNRSTLAGPAGDVGIETIELSKLYVYPNPTNGIVRVHLDNTIKNTQISILDLNGRVLSTITNSASNLELDLSKYESGIYFIRISNDLMSEEVKVVKL